MQEKGEKCNSPSILALVAALNEEVGIEFTLAELKSTWGRLVFSLSMATAVIGQFMLQRVLALM